MKKITDAFLYRSFLADLLTLKGVSKVCGRTVLCQKIKYMEQEYINLYGSNPKVDFIPVKDKYLLEENSYINIYKLRRKKTKKLKIDTPQNKNIYIYSCADWLKKRKEVLDRDVCYLIICNLLAGLKIELKWMLTKNFGTK